MELVLDEGSTISKTDCLTTYRAGTFDELKACRARIAFLYKMILSCLGDTVHSEHSVHRSQDDWLSRLCFMCLLQEKTSDGMFDVHIRLVNHSFLRILVGLRSVR